MHRFRLRTWLSHVRARMQSRHGSGADLPIDAGQIRGEFAQVSHDIDASLDDMRLITRPDSGPALLMHERLRQLGLDPGDIVTPDEDLLRSLRARCEHCRHWRKCARDIARGDAMLQQEVNAESYCPNADVFAWLAADRKREPKPYV